MYASLRALTERIARASVLLLIGTSLVACDATDSDDPTTIADLVAQQSNLTTLAVAVDAAGLEDDLSGDGPFTVFAPTDAAFDALLVDALVDDPALLSEVLRYHVVAGDALTSGELADGQTLTTLQGDELRVSISGGTVRINGATVVTPNVEADNGVVHLVDGVLLANRGAVERLSVTAATQVLVGAVSAAGLAGAFAGAEGWTVFAPVDAAFAGVDVSGLSQAELAAVLQYHVIAADAPIGSTALVGLLQDGGGEISVGTLQGEPITFRAAAAGSIVVNDGQATLILDGLDLYTDEFENVVHLIDGVLLPPSLTDAAPPAGDRAGISAR